ncbi:MAG TPA: DegT/DnrJ/EryC1/StrS family aminotransferase, partial [Gemmatimonadales bacterium]|nr:DegT/DnrJ/EryC1/StrS family aminotransferase [Gemmatimonadales bacterium]
QLRRLLLQRHGARDLLFTDSGTSALRLALTSAVSRSGAHRLVALPSWSCYDLATAADGADVEVVLYDLDPTTLGPDWSSLEAVLAHRPAAVVIVHPFGLPVPINEVRTRASATGTLVIEDAAQAVSAEFDGRPAGSHGDFGILSFGRGKGWTGGGGGALLLGAGAPVDLRLPERETLEPSAPAGGVLLKSMVQWALGRPALYGLPASLPFLGLGTTVYHAPHSPRHPTAAMAAMLLATNPLLPQEVETRRRNAERMRRAVEERGLGTVPLVTVGSPGWLRLPFLPGDQSFAQVQGAAARRLGILPGYPIALARLPGFGRRLRLTGPTAGGERLAERLFTIPTHSRLTPRDLDRLERWIRRG